MPAYKLCVVLLCIFRLLAEDQENLQQNVNKWQRETPDDKFYYVPRYIQAYSAFSTPELKIHWPGHIKVIRK